MKAMKKKMFIPRRKADHFVSRIENIPEETCIPTEEVLVRILVRIYTERRRTSNVPA